MNANFLAEETDKLDAYAEDLEKAADAEIKMRDDEIKGKRKEIRSTALSVSQKVELQRAIKKLEGPARRPGDGQIRTEEGDPSGGGGHSRLCADKPRVNAGAHARLHHPLGASRMKRIGGAHAA